MFEYTHKHHLKFGWGDELSKVPSTNPYQIYFGKCDPSQNLDWREQCIRAAKIIGESTDQPIWLAFGGGIDAEVVFHSLRLANVPFKVAICRFENTLNEHDIKWARRICDDYEIEYKIFDLNISNFITGPVFYYASKYKCISSHIPWHVWLGEQIEGFPIFAGGDLNIYRNKNEKNLFVKFQTQSSVFSRYLMETGREGSPNFFLQTPELIASYLVHPYVQTFVKTANAMRMLSIKWYKPAVYFSSWPELKYQRQDANGLELIEGLDLSIRKELKEKYEEYSTPVIFTFEKFLDLLI